MKLTFLEISSLNTYLETCLHFLEIRDRGKGQKISEFFQQKVLLGFCPSLLKAVKSKMQLSCIMLLLCPRKYYKVHFLFNHFRTLAEIGDFYWLVFWMN